MRDKRSERGEAEQQPGAEVALDTEQDHQAADKLHRDHQRSQQLGTWQLERFELREGVGAVDQLVEAAEQIDGAEEHSRDEKAKVGNVSHVADTCRERIDGSGDWDRTS